MPTPKKHLRVDNFSSTENYASRRKGRSDESPLQSDRYGHGNRLKAQYADAIALYAQKRAQVESITDEAGLYLELIGIPECRLPLESLDSAKGYRLQSLHLDSEHREVAVIFIPDSQRASLANKLAAYLNPEKDNANSQKPRNQRLVDSILHIRLANIESFWTDRPSEFPQDPSAQCWWEVWLNKRPNIAPMEVAKQFAQRVNATLGNCSVTFYNSVVILLKASRLQLEMATELISCLSELRGVKETAAVFIYESSFEQQQWANDLAARIQLAPNTNVFVSILDTGVNYQHPILSKATDETLSETWNPAWPKFSSSPTNQAQHHGSEQAGLALFGDMYEALTSTNPVVLTHQIESGRILPPNGENDPLLYGAITADTSAKLETARPQGRRVFSMAVTAPHPDQGGQPTSWSSKVDELASGGADDVQRLFVVSAGNNRSLDPAADYWDQAHLEEIEDPAQAWNALSVGAYTELTTVAEKDFDGWSPLAIAGDLSPRSRTSVSWAWHKQSPFKPEVVAEGGNVLLSPDHSSIEDADCVSLLTASGRSTGKLFSSTGATSAATALVSRQAAILTAENQNYWPETVRGLVVHSAEWTERMYQRSAHLEMTNSRITAMKTMLRTFGFGVPDLERARHSAGNRLTLVAQGDIQPFVKEEAGSSEPKLKEMHLYQLPWPTEVLQTLGPEIELRLKVTLSYFVEPNPRRRGYRNRFSYASHGLRFEVIRPEQSLSNFRAFINNLANDETYTGPEGNTDGWKFGPQLRTRGSLHSDTWTGSAAELAAMGTIAIFPVSGWWKSRTSEERWNNLTRYSLIVSIESPDQTVDLYTEVETVINTEIEVASD